jgi:selenocysteine lyase/cysteine desulfurase
VTLPCQRHLFDLPDEVAYLNCAYMGPLSKAVQRAGVDGLSRKARPWKIEPSEFFTPLRKARRLFGQLIGGDAQGVAMVSSVSYGMAIAAANLPLPPAGNIVVLAEQFPSNIYIWRQLARDHNAEVRTVPRPGDDDWTRVVLEAMNDKTAIVAVPHCHWTDGTLVDLRQIGKRARELQAALVVDGCQSIGALPLDVGVVQPDFLVTATYKWLLGPYSHGFLWVAPHWRQGRSIEQNWIARSNAENFAALTSYTDSYAEGARRFDVGEVSNFALLPAAIAALEQTLAWGVDAVQATIEILTRRIADRAQELGLQVAAEDRRAGHLMGLRLGSRSPEQLAAALKAEKIHVSVRGTSIRVSPHVYNSDQDVDRFLRVLEATLRSTPAI